MENVKLSAPWEILWKKMTALFGEDPDIELLYNDGDKVITLRVQNSSKADALAKILPTEMPFGNVTVRINVVPANDEDAAISIYQKAFDGNPAFSYAEEVEAAGFKATYVVFEKEVVQIPADNLGDINGNISTLFQDIANEVIDNHNGVFFCTDDEDPIIICDACTVE